MFKFLIKYGFSVFCLIAFMLINADLLAVPSGEDIHTETYSSGKVTSVQKETGPSENDLRQKVMRFFDKNLPAGLAKWINRSINFTYQNTLAFILIILIFYFILSTLFIIFFILFHNIRRAINEKKYRKLREFYQNNLIDFVFNQDLGAFANLACYRRKLGRAILIDEIMKMQKDVNGEAYKSLREIYIALELDRKSVKKIIRREWPRKVEGIREVSDMHVKSALPILGRYPFSGNDLLRSEAQIGIVRLNEKDPFYFLDNFKEHLTRFEQLKIYNIANRYNVTVPDFSRWFASQNDSVVMFSVKMSVLYNQGYTEKQLVKLLNHENAKIREEVIKAIGDLELVSCDQRLMDLYPEEMDYNQMAIIKALQKIPDERQIGFLARITDEGNFDRQFEAVKALYQIGELGKIRLIKIEKERDDNFKKIVKHIYDDRI